MLQRAQGSNVGTWGLPGGHTKEGESTLETAKRETEEETGVKVSGQKFGKCLKEENQKKFTTYYYQVDEQFDCVISEEHSDWKWFAIKDLQQIDLHPRFKSELPTYLKEIRKHFCKTFTEWMDIRVLTP